jgi:hypothetical protein
MELTCPKCNQQLPEVQMVDYRFCPHCGAEIAAGPLSDQTGEPQTMASRQQLNLKPPDTPPPAGFFRTSSDKNTPVFHSGEKAAPKKDLREQRTAKNRNIIIATLIILAIIILLLGGLFTF